MPISRSLPTDCWVGLVFSSPAAREVGHQRQVDEDRVAAARSSANWRIASRKGSDLDVADGAADLGDATSTSVGHALAMAP